jgi:hypothetical protein
VASRIEASQPTDGHPRLVGELSETGNLTDVTSDRLQGWLHWHHVNVSPLEQ